MSDLIQSLPSPPAYSGGITHTCMGKSWMVDGEASVMMMVMISSNSLSRQGARTEFLVAETESLSLAVKRNSSLENIEPPDVFRSQAICSPKERSRGARRRPHHPRHGLACPVPGPGVGPPWVFSAPSSGSVGLRVKYEFWDIFWNFPQKLDFCTKTRHQSNSPENIVSPC